MEFIVIIIIIIIIRRGDMEVVAVNWRQWQEQANQAIVHLHSLALPLYTRKCTGQDCHLLKKLHRRETHRCAEFSALKMIKKLPATSCRQWGTESDGPKKINDWEKQVVDQSIKEHK